MIHGWICKQQRIKYYGHIYFYNNVFINYYILHYVYIIYIIYKTYIIIYICIFREVIIDILYSIGTSIYWVLYS